MGYDMYTVTQDPEEEARIAEIRAKLEVVNQDSLRARLGGLPERHSEFRAETQRLWEEMDAARRSYFRLNIWGMGRMEMILVDLGIAFPSSAATECPCPEDFGLPSEGDVDIWDLLYEHLPHPDPYKRDALDRFAAALSAWRTDVRPVSPSSPAPPGLPLHKFSSNDGWLVTPAECTSAADRLDAVDDRRLAEVIQSMDTTMDAETVASWATLVRKFGAYWRYAAEHGGFEVH